MGVCFDHASVEKSTAYPNLAVVVPWARTGHRSHCLSPLISMDKGLFRAGIWVLQRRSNKAFSNRNPTLGNNLFRAVLEPFGAHYVF